MVSWIIFKLNEIVAVATKWSFKSCLTQVLKTRNLCERYSISSRKSHWRYDMTYGDENRWKHQTRKIFLSFTRKLNLSRIHRNRIAVQQHEKDVISFFQLVQYLLSAWEKTHNSNCVAMRCVKLSSKRIWDMSFISEFDVCDNMFVFLCRHVDETKDCSFLVSNCYSTHKSFIHIHVISLARHIVDLSTDGEREKGACSMVWNWMCQCCVFVAFMLEDVFVFCFHLIQWFLILFVSFCLQCSIGKEKYYVLKRQYGFRN